MNPSIGNSLTGKRYEWFYCAGGLTTGTATRNWFTWIKPPELTIITIVCVGGGGAGGHGGSTSTGANYAGGSATNAYGGEGGGGGAVTIHTIPAYLVPNVLYISPGSGGLMQNSGGLADGLPGSASYAAVYPSTELPNQLCFANGGAGGLWGSASTPGALGGVIASITDNSMTFLGITQVFAGIDGGNGSNNSIGNAHVTAFTVNPFCCGGAGGGGGSTSFATGGAGGNITTGGFWPSLPGGAANISTTAPSPGSHGNLTMGHKGILISVGGSGGGGAGTGYVSTASVNQYGGNGGLGSGGAGGGGSTAGYAVGDGGNGGNGYVLITGAI